MNLNVFSDSARRGSQVALVLLLLFVTALTAAPATPKAPATTTNTPAADAQQWVIPMSVFTIPTNPKEGRNPFFPNELIGAQPAKPKAAPVDIPNSFVLNGITSPPKRTAMINGRTFEVGETGEVRMPNGTKVLIKCVDIRSESAVIEVAGQRQELKMRFGV